MKYELKHPNGFVLGVACEKPDGWFFYPNVFGKSPSRHGWPTADASLPAWAKKFLKAGASFLPPQEEPRSVLASSGQSTPEEGCPPSPATNSDALALLRRFTEIVDHACLVERDSPHAEFADLLREALLLLEREG